MHCLSLITVCCMLMAVTAEDGGNENSVQQLFSTKPFTGSTMEKVGDAAVFTDDMDSQPSKLPFTWSTLWSSMISFFRGKSDGSGTKQVSRRRQTGPTNKYRIVDFKYLHLMLQLVNFVLSVLDMFKQYFMQRSAQSRGAIGIGRVGSDAASAILTMVKGYIKSASARDEGCMQRYLCEVNREVVKDAREIGYIIGKAGSSVISYMLERSRLASYDANYNASRRGLDGDDCESLTFGCNETY